MHLFRLIYDTQVTYLAMGEHDEVLAAVAARDPDAAAYAMRRHILLSGDRFRRLFDEAEDAGRHRRRGLTTVTRRHVILATIPSDPIGSDPIGLDPTRCSARRTRCPERCS